MSDYRKTLNLPTTPFPMKANLSEREPLWVKEWEKENLYARLRELNKNKPKFILHDGPPYANGKIHTGHAVNKVLKDIINRSKKLGRIRCGLCTRLGLSRSSYRAYGGKTRR